LLQVKTVSNAFSDHSISSKIADTNADELMDVDFMDSDGMIEHILAGANVGEGVLYWGQRQVILANSSNIYLSAATTNISATEMAYGDVPGSVDHDMDGMERVISAARSDGTLDRTHMSCSC
jgi:hypothetical protein